MRKKMSQSEEKKKIVTEKKFLDIISYNKIPAKKVNNRIAPCSPYFVENFKFEQNNENAIEKKDHLSKYKLTELHLAAKNGNVDEIKKIIKNVSLKEARDHYGRTPLYIAAEYGNIEAVKLLLEKKCEINVENRDGQKALFWIIARCRKLAPEILDMEGIFRELDEYLQIDKYYLKYIELQPLQRHGPDEKTTFPKVKSILEYVVEQNDLELISHPVITNFIKFKWNEIKVWSFGKFIIDLIFCVVWNLWGVLKRYDLRHEYDLSNELALLILFIIGILTLIIMMLIEIKEFIDDFRYKKSINNERINHIENELGLPENDKSKKISVFLEEEKIKISNEISLVWIPFTSSFYMLYGNGLTINCDPNSEQCLNGNKTILNEMGTYNKAMFFLYSVTLGFSEFDFEKYNEIDSEISELMVALYIGVTSLIMVNILIALITSTFERISSSSKSLYLLEKAKEIILFEHGLCESSRIKLARRVPNEYNALYKPNLEKDDLGIKNFIKPISDSVKDLNLRFKMQNMFSNILNNSDLERLENKIDNIERYVSMLANQNNDNSKVDVLYLKKNKNSP
ncbi:transient receptor potential cation channel subfamily A member 1 [Brachionus plicatilis]|uniref:Transient receptor potential cation channel subfamily A member 1 n=1 Tax=Brachionus plicatilis TaxID=10195 RepID=A0A3M7S2M8_BRAPC|nr:transient receptor potential cation channel subfamily A member 1 [Brachionus plicatilis]